MQNYTKRDIKKVALHYLANLYYDREFLTWDRFEDMAIVFHQNSYLESCWNRRTRRSFEQMSLCLLEMLKIIKRDSTEAPWLYFENNVLPISLGKMDGLNHTSHYDKIAQLSLKMRNCIKDRTFIDEYIKKEARKTKRYAQQLLEQKEIDESLNAPENKNFFNQNLSFLYHELKHGEPEDIFRQTKKVRRLFMQNNKIKHQKELKNKKIREEKVNQINALLLDEEREDVLQRAYTTLGRIYALEEVTTDKICKTVLAKDILDFEMSLHSGNIDDIQNEMARLEDIFETSTRRSRK